MLFIVFPSAFAIDFILSKVGALVVPPIILFKVPFGTPDFSTNSSIVILDCFLYREINSPISTLSPPYILIVYIRTVNVKNKSSVFGTNILNYILTNLLFGTIIISEVPKTELKEVIIWYFTLCWQEKSQNEGLKRK